MAGNNKLVLVSTFRHFFMSIGLALSDPKGRYHLVFIDQAVDASENKIFKAACRIGLPFLRVWCLPSKKRGGSKSKVRSLGFAQLRKIISEISPVEIVTGNDRRLEFQYSMYFAKNNLDQNVTGSFLDDGTGSYISFQNSKLIRYLSDKYLDTPIKKIVYGRWYSRPEVFGATNWVSKCYLAHPEVASKPLKTKELVELKRGFYLSEEAGDYFKRLSIELGEDGLQDASEKAVLFVLPHSSIIEEVYGSTEILRGLLVEFAERYSNVYFKYHPRELGDPLLLKEIGRSLTSGVPSELYCATNKFDLIVGDVSTALMAAKWLNPDADVRYLKTNSKQAELVAGLFQFLSIVPFNVKALK